MIWYVQFSFCTPCNKGQFEKYSWLPFIISDHRRKLPPLSFWLSRLWGEKAVSTVSIPTLKKPSLHSTFLSPPSLLPPIPPYRQGPGDKGEVLLDTEQDHAEEDDGEDPASDGHKQHPAIRWQQIVWSAGYQCPLEQSKNLERWETKNKTDQQEKSASS